jgi:hypothetical protein
VSAFPFAGVSGPGGGNLLQPPVYGPSKSGVKAK